MMLSRWGVRTVIADRGRSMKNTIVIDSGTTNTRVYLIDSDEKLLAVSRKEIGVRNTAADGNNGRLKNAVGDGIRSVMADKDITFADIEAVIASGMITSDIGLVEIPHLTAPAGKEELAAGMQKHMLPDVAPVPIWFIPGVKNHDKLDKIENLASMDMMRGEETEITAVLEYADDFDSLLIVLPGSHMKFVSIDNCRKIKACITSISGELLSSITNDTIIADAVKHKYVSDKTYNQEFLQYGYRQAEQYGLGRACFSVRILGQFLVHDENLLANYVLGSVLQTDIQAIRKSEILQTDSNTKVIVAGENVLAKAFADLLKMNTTFRDVSLLRSSQGLPLSVKGALTLWKERQAV